MPYYDRTNPQKQHPAWTAGREWYEHQGRQERHWRRTHSEDRIKTSVPTKRTKAAPKERRVCETEECWSPIWVTPDSERTHCRRCVPDVAAECSVVETCACGRIYCRVFQRQGEPVDSPSACEACRDREGAV